MNAYDNSKTFIIPKWVYVHNNSKTFPVPNTYVFVQNSSRHIKKLMSTHYANTNNPTQSRHSIAYQNYKLILDFFIWFCTNGLISNRCTTIYISVWRLHIVKFMLMPLLLITAIVNCNNKILLKSFDAISVNQFLSCTLLSPCMMSWTVIHFFTLAELKSNNNWQKVLLHVPSVGYTVFRLDVVWEFNPL